MNAKSGSCMCYRLIPVLLRVLPQLAAMAEMQVSGVVKIDDGAAYLRLVPVNISSSSQSSAPESTTSPIPWPKSSKRADRTVLEAINSGKVAVHPTRQPVTLQELQTSMNNIQRSLRLPRGAAGGWNAAADSKLVLLLAAAKRDAPKPKPKAIKDASPVLAIENAKDDDVQMDAIPEPILMEVEPNVEPHNTMEVDNEAHPSMETENKTELNGNMEPSSSSSGSSSSSASSTPKAALRHRIQELEGWLAEVNEDLWHANEELGLNI